MWNRRVPRLLDYRVKPGNDNQGKVAKPSAKDTDHGGKVFRTACFHLETRGSDP